MLRVVALVLMLVALPYCNVREWAYCCESAGDHGSIYVDVSYISITPDSLDNMIVSVWIKNDMLEYAGGERYMMVSNVEIMLKGKETVLYRAPEVYRVYADGRQETLKSKFEWKEMPMQSTVGQIVKFSIRQQGRDSLNLPM